jgi:hypothetical protein
VVGFSALYQVATFAELVPPIDDSIALCNPHILENVHAFVSSSKVTVGWICIVLTEKVVRSNSRSFVLSDGEPKSKW